MDMVQALDAYLVSMLTSGKLGQDQQTKIVDELHRIRRRLVRPRDASKDSEPITVGWIK